MHHNDEQQIAQALARGSKEARAKAYRLYAPMLGGVCRRYVDNDDDACDILQDSFVAIFTASSKFKWQGHGSLIAWMRRITVNQAIKHLKNRVRFADIDDIERIADTDPPDIEGLSSEQIVQCIGKLPYKYRTVFNLYIFEQKSHREIGEMLGIAENSSASRLSRAKVMLREMLNGTEE